MFTKKPNLVEIAPRKAAQWAGSGTQILVDVREPDERATLRPGVTSLHIPLGRGRTDEVGR